MSKFLDYGNSDFNRIKNSNFVDKSGLINVLNEKIDTEKSFMCISRPRRFGKSVAAKMIYAYYDRSCDSRELFKGLEITKSPDFEKHLNKYPTIYLDWNFFVSKDKNTVVNADTLYPYEIVSKVTNNISGWGSSTRVNMSNIDKATVEKYWNNQKDYFNGKQSNMLCVVDTSGSMTDGSAASAPINVAISLGMYAAERAGGPFKDHYISFSSRPQLIKIEGVDFADKIKRIYQTNLCENTNLTATFDMLLKIADRPDVTEDQIPETIVVISDMEIDSMTYGYDGWNEETTSTEMEKVRKKWAEHGHKMPKLVYWNVQARQNTILDKGEGVSFVSGMSPSIFM